MRYGFDDDLVDEPPGGSGSPGLVWVVLASMLVAIVTTVALARRERNQILRATVPSVVGLSEARARATAEGAKLILEVQERLHDALIPAGAVAWQRPLAGAQVTPGTPLRVKLSLGLPPVPVPVVAGLGQAAAIARLERSGLRLGKVEVRTQPGLPAGRCIASRPPAGSGLPPGSAVDLVVSGSGADPVGPR